MKTLFFALSLSLAFSATTPANAERTLAPATEPSVAAHALPAEESLLIALDHAIWFQEVVYIHIYDKEDKPLLTGAYTREALASDTELKAMLRKSTRFLTIDNHHYYIAKNEVR